MKRDNIFWAIYHNVENKYPYYTNKQICITTTYLMKKRQCASKCNDLCDNIALEKAN